jgi:hypothetical protein
MTPHGITGLEWAKVNSGLFYKETLKCSVASKWTTKLFKRRFVFIHTVQDNIGTFKCVWLTQSFDVHVAVHRDKFLKIKPTRCINFSDLFLGWNSTCFAQFLCPSSWVFHCTHSNGICHTGLLTACEQDQDGTAVRTVWHIPLLYVQWKTPDDGQRNCPKHVEFHSKNKFEKLVRLVGCVMQNYTII